MRERSPLRIRSTKKFKKAPRDTLGTAELPYRPEESEPILLAIYGDPIVGRALVLLLRGFRYDAKFLTASSLNEPGVLQDVRLLLLCPTMGLTSEHREVLLASLRTKLGAVQTPIVELVANPQETQSDEGRAGNSIHKILWPCSIRKLEQQIEAALLATAPEATHSAS